jgi:hypothetical protein
LLEMLVSMQEGQVESHMQVSRQDGLVQCAFSHIVHSWNSLWGCEVPQLSHGVVHSEESKCQGPQHLLQRRQPQGESFVSTPFCLQSLHWRLENVRSAIIVRNGIVTGLVM